MAVKSVIGREVFLDQAIGSWQDILTLDGSILAFCQLGMDAVASSTRAKCVAGNIRLPGPTKVTN